jgi:hypothetical protein
MNKYAKFGVDALTILTGSLVSLDWASVSPEHAGAIVATLGAVRMLLSAFVPSKK